MKGLFLRLYIFIMGCFLFHNYLNTKLLETPYLQDTERTSINYAETLTESILREHKISKVNIQELMDWWKDRSLQEGQEIKNIEIIKFSDPRIAHLTPINKSQTLNVSITEMVDQIEVVVPLARIIEKLSIDSDDLNKSDLILYRFYAAYDKQYEQLYYVGFVLIFLITATLVWAITYFIYRYLQSLSKAVNSIAAGRYETQAPQTNIDAFKALSHDIDTMSRKLKDDEIKQQIFNGAISHELRSPITRLQIALDILNSSNNMQTIKEMGAEMDTALEDLNELTDGVLQLSKAYLQHNLNEQKQISVSETLNHIINKTQDQRIITAIEQGINLHSNLHLLHTALTNLVTNACKYANQKILVSAQIINQQICITVEDDGPGIPVQELEKIFQPFYRVDSSRSRQTGGSGLGLAIVYEIVRKTHGEITVGQSQFGGAKFEITWPVEQT